MALWVLKRLQVRLYEGLGFQVRAVLQGLMPCIATGSMRDLSTCYLLDGSFPALFQLLVPPLPNTRARRVTNWMHS